MRKLISSDQAAEMLGLSRFQIIKLGNQKRLPFVDTVLGRLYSTQDLEEFNQIPRPVGRPRVQKEKKRKKKAKKRGPKVTVGLSTMTIDQKREYANRKARELRRTRRQESEGDWSMSSLLTEPSEKKVEE